jgi:hypothetical protein
VPAGLDGAFAALPRAAFLVRPHAISLAFETPLTPAQYEQLTDKELTELVEKRIGQAFERARHDLARGPRLTSFQPAKLTNRLLATP